MMSATKATRDYSLVGPDAERAIASGLTTAQWYRPDIARKQMKELMRRDDGPAIRDTALWFGYLAAFGLGGFLFWGSWWCVPFFFAYGVLYGSASDSRWHECGHGTAFKTRWMNDAVYHIACFMVLREPTPHQRSVLTELLSLVDSTVVMSRSAADLLTSGYGVDPGRLQVIPHGVPNVPLVESATIKPGLGITERDVIFSFGLLGPGKGYELAIEALPAVAAEHPSVLYVILGATHPDLLAHEGEAYRSSLVDRVKHLGMGAHVQFIDRYVGRNELIRWLQASDVFVTPYPNLGQIVSGTLSYAMGAGRAVVSTPYTYAAELLADGRGVLVAPGSAAALADGLSSVLGDAELRASIGRRAHAYSRQMIWSAVGDEYGALFARIAEPALRSMSISKGVPVHA